MNRPTPSSAEPHAPWALVTGSARGLGRAFAEELAATKAFNWILGESLWAELRQVGVDVLALLTETIVTDELLATEPDVDRFAGKMAVTPGEVVLEALDALGKKPSHIAGRLNRIVVTLLQRLLPRQGPIAMLLRHHPIRAHRRSSAVSDNSAFIPVLSPRGERRD